MSISALLDQISEDAPSGENLEYEMVFTDMSLASQYGEETQVGGHITAAEEPDFAELAKAATEVLRQSHDIRAAVFLGEAVLHTKGLEAFAEVTALLRGFMETFWETCHPQLDEDDGDATMRINAVQGLADKDRLLRALRRTGLTDSRVFGKMTLRDVDIADGKITPPADMESVPDSGSVSAAFKDTDEETLAKYSAATKAALEDVQAIDAVFGDKTPGDGPQLDDLINALRSIDKIFGRHLGEGGSEDADGNSDAGGASSGGGQASSAPMNAGPSGGGAINSPADVTAALDRIMAYYARSEPSSPLPILLERAKRLVSADFLTIIEDMAAEGLQEVQQIGGIKRSSDDY